MIIESIKKLFNESLTKKLFYKVKLFPPIRIFFDFDYAGSLWNQSFLKQLLKKLVLKTGIHGRETKIRAKEKYLPYMLASCVYFLFVQGNLFVPAGFVVAAFFLPYSKNKDFALLLFFLTAMSVFLFACVSFSTFFYIIYVETGILLFFIIKYSSEKVYKRFIWLMSCLWVAGIFLKNGEALVLIFLPYALEGLKRNKIKKYFYGAILLVMGFYILSRQGGGAVIGASAGIALMILSGEFWLAVPVIFAAPAVIAFVYKILNVNIVATGYFFWRYGFGGAAVSYGGISRYAETEIVSHLLYPMMFIFFWYVLKLSRSALIKLFKKETKRRKFLKSGVASLIGFSVYTFFEYNENLLINIALYLLSAALLKRQEGLKHEEENERKWEKN